MLSARSLPNPNESTRPNHGHDRRLVARDGFRAAATRCIGRGEFAVRLSANWSPFTGGVASPSFQHGRAKGLGLATNERLLTNNSAPLTPRFLLHEPEPLRLIQMSRGIKTTEGAEINALVLPRFGEAHGRR